jgi:hypothetical protein
MSDGKMERDMKKLMIAVIFVGTMVFTGCGGSGNRQISRAVPNKVLKEFHDDFPLAKDVDWKMKNGLYKANFEIMDKNMDAVYTADGDRISIGS